jgi:hypothetical protein
MAMNRVCGPAGNGVVFWVAASMLAFASVAAVAEEVDVLNDSAVDGSTVAIQAGFVAGESAAAWLTSPCDGNIVAVQVFWLSLFGGTGDSLEDSITIFAGGTFPAPGAELAFLEGPVVRDGFLNEFRSLDEAGAIPIEVPVETGETFVVSFRFLNDPDPLFGPSVCTDFDGCQGGRNAYQTTSGTWRNLCAEGVSGDLVIRAVVDCAEPTGACCNSNGICADEVLAENCQQEFDTFFPDQSCAEVTCPEGTGACCNGEGGCLQNQTETFCEEVLGGIYAGRGTDCDDDVCVLGACCRADGSCDETVGILCRDEGDLFQGPGTTCAETECPEPLGACCVATTCVPDQTLNDCFSFTGIWAGPLTECFDGICPICDDGDANGDLQVDLADFGFFQHCFGAAGTGECKCLDMDNNNVVDLDDYVLFEEALSGGGP